MELINGNALFDFVGLDMKPLARREGLRNYVVRHASVNDVTEPNITKRFVHTLAGVLEFAFGRTAAAHIDNR